MKLYKKIEQENGTVAIYGSNKKIKLEASDANASNFKFRYKDRVYYLDEFIAVPIDSFLEEFDGYCCDSFFSGVAIKLCDYGEAVKAYTFIAS